MTRSLSAALALQIVLMALVQQASLGQEATSDEVRLLKAEIQMLRGSVRRHLERNNTLKKDKVKLEKRVGHLVKICEEHGIDTAAPGKEEADLPEGNNEKPPGLDGPLNEEQRAVLKQLKSKAQSNRAEWKRSKYKQCLGMMSARAEVAKKLAEYGQATECLRTLRSMAADAAKSSKVIGYYHWSITSPLSKGGRDSANALLDQWQAFDSAMSALKISAPLLRTDLLRLHEVADTYRSIGLKARKREDKLAALNAAVDTVLLATPLKTATATDIERLAKLCDKVTAETKSREHKAAALEFYRMAVKKDATLKNAWTRIRTLEKELESDDN